MNYVKFTAVMAGSIALKKYLEDQKILPDNIYTHCIYTYTMATIAIMIGGGVLNAATFIGGNYLAKALSGDSGQAALDEKIRHDKALEAYQAAYAKYQKDRTELLDWIAEQDREKDKAIHDFQDTDRALALYNQTPKNPSSLTSTHLVHSKRMANYCSSVRARLHLGMQPCAFFRVLIPFLKKLLYIQPCNRRPLLSQALQSSVVFGVRPLW